MTICIQAYVSRITIVFSSLISTQLVTISIILLRFMSYPYYHRANRIIGPASHKYYDERMVVTDPAMASPPNFRAKISRAVSHLYFVQPHSVIRSQIENRPLSDYYSSKLYEQATLLYFGGSTPGQDLRECMQDVERSRYTYQHW
jgi:hypothetical protein